MLRKYLLILTFLSLGKAFAYEPEIAFGTRQGADLSFVWFYPEVNTKMMEGYVGGFTSRFIFEKYFGLQVELNYMQRGWREDYENFKYQRRLHYAELPFMTHIFFGNKTFRWFFNAGLVLGYNFGENKTFSEISKPRAEHNLLVSNRFDYGICGGTGFEIHTRAGIYQLDGRYNFGLGDIFPNRMSDDFSRSSNQNISICLGVLFDINKEKYRKK